MFCLFILGLIFKGCKHSAGGRKPALQTFDILLCDYSETQTHCEQFDLIPQTFVEQQNFVRSLWFLPAMCSLAPGGSSPACLEEREVHSSDCAASTKSDIHACTNRNTHQLKDYNRADPAMKTPVSAVGVVCVCACVCLVGPLGS